MGWFFKAFVWAFQSLLVSGKMTKSTLNSAKQTWSEHKANLLLRRISEQSEILLHSGYGGYEETDDAQSNWRTQYEKEDS